jgi:alpha-L-fucosidase
MAVQYLSAKEFARRFSTGFGIVYQTKYNSMKLRFNPCLAAFLLLALNATAAPQITLCEQALQQWQSNRFGMFIHWGPISLLGEEISWSRANSNTNCPNNGNVPVEVYDNLYKRFDPTNFNATDWVDIAKSAGMKYMVLTAKHGDGFLLWPSKVDPYNIGATPFRRDICGELAEAAHSKNMELGWYYSPMDWRDPDCRSTNNARFNQKCQRELRELLSNYGKISVLWFDTDGRTPDWDPVNTYALVRQLQPAMLLNNRLEMGTHNEWINQGNLRPNEDFYTPEQRIGAYDDKTPWETCMTLGTQWSWKLDDKLKTPAEVVSILARTLGGSGNLLLDVGPMPDGRIEPRQVEILNQVGAWLRQNGESVYGTRGGPWKPTPTATSTRRGNTIYIHVLKWRDDAIELPDIPRNIQSASLIGGTKIQIAKKNGKIEISAPPGERDALDTVVKLQLDGSAMDLAAVEIAPQVKTTASNVFENQDADYGPQFAFDDDNNSRWATDNNIKQAWITAEYPSPQKIGGVSISEAYPGRVQKFEFQYRDGGNWKTVFTGTTIGAQFEKHFPPLTAEYP